MIDREKCPLRHANGNCLSLGGFCTAVNDEICAALHNAYYSGYSNGVTVQRWIPVTERPPTEENHGIGDYVLAIIKDEDDARMWWWELVAKYPQSFTHWMPLPDAPKKGNT